MDPYRSLLQTAVDHHNAGRLAKAETIYRDVLRKKPDHPDALRLLGDIAMRMGVSITSPLAVGTMELLPYLVGDENPPTSSPENRTLVLGAALNYRAGKVAPFVRSLREHYSGDVVLLINAPELPSFLDRHNVAHRHFPIGERASNLTVFRHALKLQYLRENAASYGRVLFVDVGDVIFQGDPFAIPGEPALVTFEEDRRFTIGSQPTNATWLQRFFGDDILAALRDKPISCGGITLGTAQKLMTYLRLQLAFMCTARQDRAAFFGIDQATHNFIAHMKLIDGFEVRKNYGHCANLGLTEASRVRMDKDGVIRVDEMPPSPIVHQYNYVQGFTAAIDRRYASDL